MEESIRVIPIEVKDDKGNISYAVGIGLDNTVRRGLWTSLKHATQTTCSLYKLMLTTLKQLITGKFSVSDLSGPVGIYSVVDSQSKQGLESILYLILFNWSS